MPRNQYGCCADVKKSFISLHKSCSDRKPKQGEPPLYKSGIILQEYCKEIGTFDKKKDYKTCYNFMRLIDRGSIKKVASSTKIISPNSPPPALLSQEIRRSPRIRKLHTLLPAARPRGGTRSERSSNRRKRIEGTLDLAKVKRLKIVRVKVDDKVMESEINIGKMRKGKNLKFYENLLEISKPYKFSYRKLEWRQRMTRTNEATNMLLAMCLDRNELEKDGLSYITGNETLVHDVLNIVHGIKEKLEKTMKVDLTSVEYPIPCPLIDGDKERGVIEEDGLNVMNAECNEDEDEQEEHDDNQSHPVDHDHHRAREDDGCKQQDEMYEVGAQILKETSGRAYDRMIKQIQPHMLENKKLPSNHMLNKLLPMEVECTTHVFNKSEKTKHKEEAIEAHVLGLNCNEEEGDSKKDRKKHDDDIMLLVNSDFGSTTITDDGEECNVAVGAKLKGSFGVSVETLVKKFNKNTSTSIKDGEDIIILSSWDGAEALKSKKQNLSVISFSSSLLTKRHIQDNLISAGQSCNILTWLQVVGKEDPSLVKECLHSNYFIDRTNIVENGLQNPSLKNSSVFCLHVDDVKMLYVMTQHSLWNRKHHPFLLCKCKRGETTNNEEHVCTPVTDEEYKNDWNRSLRRWDYKVSKCASYTVDSHRNWCDENNYGVTHFGCTPDDLPMSSIYFDIMHMQMAITRRFMTDLRRFVLRRSSEQIKMFSENILRTFWGNYHVYCWNNKMNFSKFEGTELSLFVENIPLICEYLEKSFISTENLKMFTEGLRTLPMIFSFLKLSYIEDSKKYEELLVQFEVNLKLMYKCGKSTYLVDNDEPFYFHCLRFYMPRIAKQIYEKYHLGLGIFNMQGFERRNKESKNMLLKYSTNNKKSPKILVNNMRRLQQNFWYSKVNNEHGRKNKKRKRAEAQEEENNDDNMILM